MAHSPQLLVGYNPNRSVIWPLYDSNNLNKEGTFIGKGLFMPSMATQYKGT